MLDFFSHFAIQMAGVATVFVILYLVSKARKPKAGETTEQEILNGFALVRLTVLAPLMFWFIPAFVILLAVLFSGAIEYWPIPALFMAMTAFYIGWSASFGFRYMFKRNFMAARIAYMKSPKTYNEAIKNDPRVAKRLMLYPAGVRKVFAFLADAKWF